MSQNLIRIQIDGISPNINNKTPDDSSLKTTGVIGAGAGLAARGTNTFSRAINQASEEDFNALVRNPFARQQTKTGRQLARRVAGRNLRMSDRESSDFQQYAKNIGLPGSQQVAAGITAIAGVSTFVLNHLEQNAAMRGANHKADQLSNAKNAVGTVAGISTAFLIGGPIGGAVAIAGMAYKEAMDAKREIREFKVSAIERQDTLRRLNRTVTEGRF